MRGFRRFGELQARREWPPRQSMSSELIEPDGARMVILGAERIALMKNTAILVNIFARQGGGRSGAGARACRGPIKGAGLDALAEEPLSASSPLWDLLNVLITPHVGGGGGRQQWRRMSELIRDNTRRYLSGDPLKHVVRTPDGTLQGF